jgi:A/G-specific adenine glycosylase
MSGITIDWQARALLDWYAAHEHARRLPWRRAEEPLDRRAMVEGLLAQTRAARVAEWYGNIFHDVRTAADWINLGPEDRENRVAALGLPAAKVAAVSAIADVLVVGVTYERLVRALGLGPYIAGMVAVLFDLPAVPVDANVLRVGARVDEMGDPERWMAEIVEAALAAHPGAAYRAVSAVLDLGAGCCSLQGPDCHRCPLRASCTSAPMLGRQLLLPGVEDPCE